MSFSPHSFLLFSFQSICSEYAQYAPIAQLVEQLTLNQRVPGSSPCWCTIRPVGQAVKTPASHAGIGGSIPPRVTIVGTNGDEGPPVPIPNTEVKLISVENTWLATAWEDRAVPTYLSCGAGKFIYQLLIRILGRGH